MPVLEGVPLFWGSYVKQLGEGGRLLGPHSTDEEAETQSLINPIQILSISWVMSSTSWGWYKNGMSHVSTCFLTMYLEAWLCDMEGGSCGHSLSEISPSAVWWIKGEPVSKPQLQDLHLHFSHFLLRSSQLNRSKLWTISSREMALISGDASSSGGDAGAGGLVVWLSFHRRCSSPGSPSWGQLPAPPCQKREEAHPCVKLSTAVRMNGFKRQQSLGLKYLLQRRLPPSRAAIFNPWELHIRDLKKQGSLACPSPRKSEFLGLATEAKVGGCCWRTKPHPYHSQSPHPTLMCFNKCQGHRVYWISANLWAPLNSYA